MIIKSFELEKLKSHKSNLHLIFGNNDGIIETDSTKLNKRPYERLEMLAWPEILELK